MAVLSIVAAACSGGGRSTSGPSTSSAPAVHVTLAGAAAKTVTYRGVEIDVPA